MVVLTSSVPAMPIMTKGLAAAKVDLQLCMNWWTSGFIEEKMVMGQTMQAAITMY